MGTSNPMSSDSAVLSQTTFVQAEASTQLRPRSQPVSLCFFFLISLLPCYPQSVSQNLEPHCSSPEPIASCNAGLQASRHLSNVVWVKHLVPMHGEEGEGCLHPTSAPAPARP